MIHGKPLTENCSIASNKNGKNGQGFASGGGAAFRIASRGSREAAPPGGREGRAAVRIAPPRAPRRPPPAVDPGPRGTAGWGRAAAGRRASPALLPLALLLQRGHRGLSTRPPRPINAATKAYERGHQGLSTWPQRPINVATEAYQRGHEGPSMRPQRPINAATKADQCGHEGPSLIDGEA